MAAYGFFQPSTLGMMGQAKALSTIGLNVANVNTGGYRGTDTQFQTLISKEIDNQGDLGGLRPVSKQNVDKQGLLRSSDRDLDVAIVGGGFFQVSPTLTVSNEIFYTRDGSFQINVAGAKTTATGTGGGTISVSNGYLTDKNGYFLLGEAPATDGTFPATPGTLAPMRVDQFAFINAPRPTSTAKLTLNLPAQKEFGEAAENYNISINDSNGARREINLAFLRDQPTGQWGIIPTADNVTTLSLTGSAFSLTTGAGPGTQLKLDSANNQLIVQTAATGLAKPGAFFGLKAGDSITVAGAAGANNGTFTISGVSSDFSTLTISSVATTETVASTTLTSTQVISDRLTFSDTGAVQTPATKSYTVSATWSAGATSSFTLDVSDFIQLAGDFTPFGYSHNGLSQANLNRVQFDNEGHVVGTFDDGTVRKIYKVPIASFSNPNGLEAGNGMVFAETELSGTANSQFIDTSGIAQLNPFTVELSNIDLASEFTKMIMVQNAYNSSATVFKTVDEMTTVARDLKG